MNLISNTLPKDLITFQAIFNPDDQARSRGLNLAENKDDRIWVAIADGKTISLGKVFSEVEQENLVHLLQEFNGIFTWVYDNLNSFDPSLFQHTIDLYSDAKPLR